MYKNLIIITTKSIDDGGKTDEHAQHPCAPTCAVHTKARWHVALGNGLELGGKQLASACM
jgi:hypothetical protein